MPGKRSSGNDGELLAFAQAVGNYADVSAAAAEESERGGEQAEQIVAEASVREAIVPLLGMRMAVSSVELGYARLVRAGSLAEAPDEAVGSDENVFAAIGCGGSMQAPLAATSGLRQFVTTLRA